MASCDVANGTEVTWISICAFVDICENVKKTFLQNLYLLFLLLLVLRSIYASISQCGIISRAEIWTGVLVTTVSVSKTCKIRGLYVVPIYPCALWKRFIKIIYIRIIWARFFGQLLNWSSAQRVEYLMIYPESRVTLFIPSLRLEYEKKQTYFGRLPPWSLNATY